MEDYREILADLALMDELMEEVIDNQLPDVYFWELVKRTSEYIEWTNGYEDRRITAAYINSAFEKED